MPGIKLEIFNGIVELAKAGYKPSDVKDIMESLKTDPDLDAKGGSGLKEDTPETKPETKPAEASKQEGYDALAAIIKRESEA